MQEDIGFPVNISSITYVRQPYAGGWVGNFSIKMAHVTIDELSQTFADNYVPGSLEEVVHIDSLSLIAPPSMLTIEFDQPFQYNGTDNLLIDIWYTEGYSEAAVYNWEAGPARCVYDFFLSQGSAGPTGVLSSELPYMIIEGEMGLEPYTFGRVKITLGGTN